MVNEPEFTLTQLRYFVAVAEAGSITEAARSQAPDAFGWSRSTVANRDSGVLREVLARACNRLDFNYSRSVAAEVRRTVDEEDSVDALAKLGTGSK